MNFIKSKVFWLIAVAIIVAILILSGNKLGFIGKKSPEDTEIIIKKNIEKGMTFGKLAEAAGLSGQTANLLLSLSKDAYDLSKIVSGKEAAFVFDKATGDLVRFEYPIDTEERLRVEREAVSVIDDRTGETRVAYSWQAEREDIPYEVKVERVDGAIDSSLYETMQADGLDVRLTLALAETFAWQIDFAADIQKGDSFKVLYEKRYLNGEYVMPGKILAGEFINSGKTFRGFYFASERTKAGQYDEEGSSLQKVFLKAPLQYKYISSGFSYARFNPITRKVSPHRGIDYAAPAGTPAVSVGDGTVTQAGWNGYYGISVTVRHNDTYQTVYGHFSSLAKGIRVGAKVSQGQVVGYVGSTGLATGPHLHYEMHKFGNYVNPFTVEVPPGEPIADTDKEAFARAKGDYLKQLQ